MFSTKLIRYKYSDIYNMAEDTLEFAKLNLVAMLHAEKWQLACQCFSYLGNVCVSFSHDRWHNASGPLSWHFDIFSKTNKSELCTAGIRFSLILLGFRLCFWCSDEIGIGWYSLTCTVHTIENARRFFKFNPRQAWPFYKSCTIYIFFVNHSLCNL